MVAAKDQLLAQWREEATAVRLSIRSVQTDGFLVGSWVLVGLESSLSPRSASKNGL